ncbi:MAG: NINE protein [Candidatus Thorarchaeota archaeon]
MAKSKITAGLLAFFLGSLGLHKFYLDKWGQGIIYLLFCWTFIPAIISFFEAIYYWTRSDQEFAQKYDPDYGEVYVQREYVPVRVETQPPPPIIQTTTKEIIREREIVFIRCQSCNMKNEEGSKYCTHCGAHM